MVDHPPDEVLLLLDENISPAIAPRLWEANVNAVPIRDRAMLRARDNRIFDFARREQRALVTIDQSDFTKLAERHPSHPGVIVMPSGGGRDEQFDYTMAVCDWARNQGAAMMVLRDRITSVDEEMNIISRLACAEPASLRVVASFPPSA